MRLRRIMEVLKMLTENMAGCWFDGADGFVDNAIDIICFAQSYGYEFSSDWSEEEKNAVLSWTAWDEWEEKNPGSELLMFAVESAETYLDDFAPDCHFIGWHDEGFGLWKFEEEKFEEEEDEFDVEEEEEEEEV